MSTISVNLPDSVLLEVAQRAEENGFSDVGEFVSQMIAQIIERQTQVEKLAIEGIESGPSEPWSTAEIEAIRNDLRSKHGR
jgi:metal-responsive CopG/Arc/MetJ family transcriptional regulator